MLGKAQNREPWSETRQLQAVQPAGTRGPLCLAALLLALPLQPGPQQGSWPVCLDLGWPGWGLHGFRQLLLHLLLMAVRLQRGRADPCQQKRRKLQGGDLEVGGRSWGRGPCHAWRR